MFLENVKTAAMQVGILYIIVAVGFICDKAHIYTAKASKLTNDLLFYIVTPAIIIRSFTSIPYSAENLRDLLYAFAGGTALHLVAILLSFPLFKKSKENTRCVYKYACVYGNVGYMALPLAEAVLGAQGVFFCSGVLIPFNIFAFSHGVRLMTKTGSQKSKLSPKLFLLNPGVISVLIGLPLFLMKTQIPYMLSKPIDYIASLNTPLAMLMFGTYLAQTNLKVMFRRKETYLVALIKLIVLPSVMFGFLKLCGISGMLLTALLISSSAPSANNTVMFAAKYNKDNAAASQTVAVVSFLSILTMPVVIAISQL